MSVQVCDGIDRGPKPAGQSSREAVRIIADRGTAFIQGHRKFVLQSQESLSDFVLCCCWKPLHGQWFVLLEMFSFINVGIRALKQHNWHGLYSL